MKEFVRSKLMGKKLYKIYRILRFIFFKKRIEKRKQKALRRVNKLERREIRNKIKERNRIEKDYENKHNKVQKTKNKQKQILLKQKIKEKTVEYNILEKRKIKKLKQENKEKKIEYSRLQRQKMLKSIKTLFYEIITADIKGLKQRFKWFLISFESKEDRKSFLTIFINSLILFLLSYFILFNIGQIIKVWVSQNFNYNTILFYYKIYYNIDSGDWTSDSVKILFSVSPLTGLLFGTLSLIIFSRIKNEPGIFKLFFLWGFIHGMVMFFGSLLMGTLLNKGFGWVISYLYYRDTGKMVFSIISIFALVLIGSGIAKSFLISCNSYYNNINEKVRKFMFLSQILFPSIVGVILLILFKIPNDFYYTTNDEVLYESLKILTLFMVLISLGVTFHSSNEIFFDLEKRKIKVKWNYLIITSILFIVIRLVTMDGIKL